MKTKSYSPFFNSSQRYLLIFIICFISMNAVADDLRTGSAVVKITPPLGTPLEGYYYARGATGIHDDLFARALVIEIDGTRAAFVSCDLVIVSAELVTKVRSIVEKTVGIKSDHVMISATHSHTGPVIPEKFGDIYKATGTTAEIHKKYISELPGLIAQSIELANSSLASSRLFLGEGREESISFNRRFFMTDGTVGWNPGKLNPKIIKPAGPIDPQVYILFAEKTDGKPVATYVNFAVHLDNVGGTEISADMPYTLSKILGKIKNDNMATLFAQGCAGNINHINVKTKDPQKGHYEAQRIGTVLAGEVIKTYTRLQPLEITGISAKREIVKLPLADVKPEEIPLAREVIARDGKPNAPTFIELVNAYKVIDVSDLKGKPVDSEIQVITLGDKCAIVGLDGEVFTELGMYIKSRSPYQYTMVVELANGCIGYVPDMKAYIEGNYEPVSARCGPGSGEILAENALKILNELKLK